jgi:hypothetical protein
MSYKKLNNLDISGCINTLKNLSKTYMESIAVYENNKNNKGTTEPSSLEPNADDEMFSDCIYLN